MPRRVYDAATEARLQHFNDYVGLYYWIGLIGIILIVTIANWAQRFQGFLRRREAGYRARSKPLPRTISADRNPHYAASIVYFWPWLSSLWRKHSVRQSSGGVATSLASRLNLGNVGQLVLMAAFLGLNLFLMLLGTNNDIDWIAHHAAILVYANIPLVIGLCSKNNVLSKLTGFAYESLNVLHRWSARVIIVLSIVHVAGRIKVNDPNVRPDLAGQRYVAWGWLGFAIMLWMVITASRAIRNRAYQFFVAQHAIMWLFLVAALAVHRPQQQGWIWAGFALFCLDGSGRLGRIVFYHFVRTVPKDLQRPVGKVTILSEDTVRVSVRTRQNWRPGQHVFLHCPGLTLGGHPFTVSNIALPLNQTDSERPSESTQELLIRVREGLTSQIMKHGGKAGGYEVPLKAWTEGPYGHEKYLGEDYDTLCLIAGGSGVTYVLSNAMDIVRRARAMHLGYTEKGIAIATKRLHFVWVVKVASQIDWIGHHLSIMLELAPPGLLHVSVYVTADTATIPIMPGYVTTDNRRGALPTYTPTHGSTFNIFSGRPDFQQLVEEEVAATKYSDWLAIGCCGPLPMNHSIAESVSRSVWPSAVLRGEVRRNIYLTIEEFGW